MKYLFLFLTFLASLSHGQIADKTLNLNIYNSGTSTFDLLQLDPTSQDGKVLGVTGGTWGLITAAGSGDVTAASAFGTDNRLIRSDGTGKGLQSSGITLSDADELTGVASITATTGTISSLVIGGVTITPSGTELNYVDGVTSAIQTQLDARFGPSTKAEALQAALFAADAGVNDTYTATLSPAITAYTTGASYRFKANTANTGEATINLNALGAKTIKKVAGGITTDLSDNDIRAGQWVDVTYDGTNMQMASPLGNSAIGGSVATDAIWTANGDIVYGTGVGTSSILPIGSENYGQIVGPAFTPIWAPVVLPGLNNTFTGSNVFNYAPRIPRTDLGANLASGTTLTLGIFYTGTYTGSPARTLTFSGTPSEGSQTAIKLTVTNAPILNIPSCVRQGEPNTPVTTIQLSNGTHTLKWTYWGGEYVLEDTVGTQNTSDGFASDAGANDTYTATLPLPIAAYTNGLHYRFKANTANTGAATINFNAVGAKTIKKAAGGLTTDLADNDIRAGQWVDLIYDSVNDIMQMQSTLGNAASGSGDFVGPGSSTDNAIVRFDSTTGKLGQNSTVTIDDNGAVTVPEMTAPGTPAAGKVSFYAKSDGLLYSKDDAGVETVMTGGGGAGDFLANGSIPMTGPLTFTGTSHAGLTPNKLTSVQRDALTPVAGNTIYNTTTSQLEYFNGTVWTATSGGSGTPGGSTTQVQYNDAGAFGGEAAFVYNKTTDTLTVTNLSVTGAAGFPGLYGSDGTTRLNVPYTVYGAGTAYSLTATAAAIDLGTTDPVRVISKPGTYSISGRVNLKYNGATFAANRDVTIKLRRTNNTAGDIADSTTTVTTNIVTTTTGTFLVLNLPQIIYTTTNSDDSITIFASVAVIPSAGSLDVTEASIVATRLYE